MLNVKSLREQIYEYLREEMDSGKLISGSALNLAAISDELGVSKTPLRDALIQLEAEGFVSILPRRGILVKKLTLQDIKESYEIIGPLEASVLLSIFEKFTPSIVAEMERLNTRQSEAIDNREFENYYRLNLEFHGVFLNLTDNGALKRTLTLLKQRLYDFPRRRYLKEWEYQHLNEHQQLIDYIKAGNPEGAAQMMKDVHWSFAVHETYFSQFYKLK